MWIVLNEKMCMSNGLQQDGSTTKTQKKGLSIILSKVFVQGKKEEVSDIQVHKYIHIHGKQRVGLETRGIAVNAYVSLGVLCRHSLIKYIQMHWRQST